MDRLRMFPVHGVGCRHRGNGFVKNANRNGRHRRGWRPFEASESNVRLDLDRRMSCVLFRSGDSAAGEARLGRICPAGKDSGHAGAKDDAGKLRSAQVFELLGKHVSALEVRNHKTATRAVLPAMLAAGTGTLLYTTGGSSVTPAPVFVSAGMAGAALRKWALTLNGVLAGRGVYAGPVA